MLNAKFTTLIGTDSNALIAMLTRRLAIAIAGAVGGLLAVAATFDQSDPWPALESTRWFRDILLPFALGSLAGVLGALLFERLDPENAGVESFGPGSAVADSMQRDSVEDVGPELTEMR